MLLEDRIAPLEASGSARMIEALRKTPRVEVPYKRPLGIAAAALAIAQRPGNERAGQSPRRGGPVAAARTPDDRQAGTLRSLSPARPRRFPVRRQVGFRPGDRAGDRRRREGADPGPRPATRTRIGRVAGCPGHTAHGGLAGREIQHLGSQPKAPRGGRIARRRRLDRRGPRILRPPCGHVADERHLGRRLVRPGRHARLRRHGGPSARDPRSPPPRPELRAAEGRLAGHLAAAVACPLRHDGRTGRGGRRGDPLSLVAGPALGRLAGGPGTSHRRCPLRTAPRELAIVQRRRAGRRAAGVHRRVAAVSEDRAGLAATSCKTSASAVAWPTTWAWARPSRCWPCCSSGARGPPMPTAAAPPSLAVVPRSLVFNWIEEAKRFTPDLRVLDYTGLQRGDP